MSDDYLAILERQYEVVKGIFDNNNVEKREDFFNDKLMNRLWIIYEKEGKMK